MKVPKAKKMSSGNWFIQLRLGGRSIPITAATEKACTRDAMAVKAAWLAEKRLPAPAPEPECTLSQAIDHYIEAKSRTLSPSTVRGYRAIQKHRFQSTMGRRLNEIGDGEWQGLISEECALAAPKTVNNAFNFLCSVVKFETGREISKEHITLPSAPPPDTAFLQPEEIKVFVQEIKDNRVAVAALLALSSLRISEISALRWENIPEDPKFIRVAGAVVRGEDTTWVRKKQNKNRASTRNVPIMIPELKEAIKRDRKPSGPVMDYDQDTLRENVHKVCRRNQLTDVTVHGLRHSFASLAYHLQIPEKIAMEIGGWSDPGTMHQIYTHIAKSDISRYQNAMAEFYAPAKEEGQSGEHKNAK